MSDSLQLLYFMLLKGKHRVIGTGRNEEGIIIAIAIDPGYPQPEGLPSHTLDIWLENNDA